MVLGFLNWFGYILIHPFNYHAIPSSRVEKMKNWNNEMDVIYLYLLYLRLYVHLFICILLYFDGAKKEWKKKKKRKNEIQRQNFSSKISLEYYIILEARYFEYK